MKKFLLVLVILLAWNCRAQYEGFYSNKNEVSVSAGLCFPSINPFQLLNIYEYREKYYRVRNNRLRNQTNVIDMNYSVFVSRTIKNNFGIGFEFNYERGNVGISPISAYGLWISNDFIYVFENFRTNTFSFIPKLIFASKNGLLPIGLSHHLGIGVSYTKVRSREYAYHFSSYIDYYTQSNDNLAITDYNIEPIDYSFVAKNLELLYQLNVKTPISKTITLNYGICYNLNIPIGYSTDITSGSYIVEDSELNQDIISTRLRKVASFNVGISYLF